MVGDILTIIRVLVFDLVLTYHTWIVAVVGFVIFLIPVTRKHWWIPLAALVVLGIIWFALVTPLNSLNVLAQSFWFFSAAVCLSYGYGLALIMLGIKKLMKKETSQ